MAEAGAAAAEPQQPVAAAAEQPQEQREQAAEGAGAGAGQAEEGSAEGGREEGGGEAIDPAVLRAAEEAGIDAAFLEALPPELRRCARCRPYWLWLFASPKRLGLLAHNPAKAPARTARTVALCECSRQQLWRACPLLDAPACGLSGRAGVPLAPRSEVLAGAGIQAPPPRQQQPAAAAPAAAAEAGSGGAADAVAEPGGCCVVESSTAACSVPGLRLGRTDCSTARPLVVLPLCLLAASCSRS